MHPLHYLQPACKPDSVRFNLLLKEAETVSIIYLVPTSLSGSHDLPPDIGRAALSAGIHGLSTHDVYGFLRHHRNRWALTPPFHPYPTLVRRSFSVTLIYPHGYLPVKKHGALCCPDFPLQYSGKSRIRERWNGLLLCKVSNYRQYVKISYFYELSVLYIYKRKSTGKV